jgi:carboxymethylenebutenolidase
VVDVGLLSGSRTLDYYGRTAGIGSRGGDFDHRPHLQLATDANVGLDVAAAVAYLRSSEGGGAIAVFTVGFCSGGRLSFNQAASPQGLVGVVGFYPAGTGIDIACHRGDDRSA